MLRFIEYSGNIDRTAMEISIHPMLRFINATPQAVTTLWSFQYIPCYGLSNWPEHSCWLYKISIHPMLRFIFHIPRTTIPILDFNTSHVTVYRISGCYLYGCWTISIHPMLRFIGKILVMYGRNNTISIHPMLRFISITSTARISSDSNFNTSHVTVYHLYEIAVIFATSISIHPMLRFIGNQGIFHCNRT